MSKTKLLPPFTAIRMVWARTGEFSNDTHSQLLAELTKTSIKDFKDSALASANEQEKAYILGIIATMEASLRNLDIVYKARNMNFDENEKLRSSFLETIKDNLDFGNKAKDFIKTLPTITIGIAGGAVTLGQLLPNLNMFQKVLLGLVTGAVAYFIHIFVVRKMRRQTQRYYLQQDYERGLYYDQYIKRASMILISLYNDLERIHKGCFGENYTDTIDVLKIVEDMLSGVKNISCKNVHIHIRSSKITPELWPVCESGNFEAIQKCPYWTN